MNILLWILQVLLALHTAVGAVWKFSNSEQTVPSLSAIPHGVWIGMSVIELVVSVALVLPVVYPPAGILAPIAALCIAAEMLFFTAVHFASGDPNFGPVTYWLVVAVICAFIAFGRFKLMPIK